MSSLKIEEYRNTILACAMAGSLLEQYDIPAMLNAIEQADTIGPMIDPTLWMKNHQKMYEDKELLEAALPLWRFAKKIKEKNGSTR